MKKGSKKIPKVKPRIIYLNQLFCPKCKEIVVEQEEEFVEEDRFECEECGLVIKPNTQKYYARRRVAWKENEIEAVILKAIEESGPMTISEMSKEIRCTRKLTSKSCRGLIAKGIIEERERWKLYLVED